MRLTVSIDIIKSNLTLSIDRLLSVSYFSLTIKQFILTLYFGTLSRQTR